MSNRLRLLTSHRLEALADALAHRLREDPAPPLVEETIVVPSRGMGRWVNVHLARAHGIAASLAFPFPFTWARRVVEELGLSPERDAWDEAPDPFAASALVWRVYEALGRLDLLDAGADELRPLRTYLEGDGDGRRRGQLAMRLASVFAGYQMQRPRELAAWGEGGWFGPEPDRAAGEAWQASLWRALVASAETPPLSDALLRAREGLRSGTLTPPEDLRRVEVFGVTTLPPVILGLLEALADQVEVVVSFVSPTQGYWGDLRARPVHASRDLLAVEASEPWDDALEPGQGPPLLASWGRIARDFHEFTAQLGTGQELVEIESEPFARKSVLGTLQADLLEYVDRGEGRDAEPLPWVDDDRSLRVHLCHSELREMEVLRDEILRAFEDLGDLRPSDVLVLVPDLERYAPFARAVLGRALVVDDRRRRIPVRMADRQGVQDQPYARLLLELLRLPDARLRASEVLDLFEIEPFARRFDLAAEELPTLRALVRAAGIRWGEDPEGRARRLGLPVYEGGSWQEGLDRLLLGFATGESDDLVEGLLPVGSTGSGRAEIAARLARATHHLLRRVRALEGPHALARWAELLREALLGLTTAESELDTHRRQEVLDALGALESSSAGFGLEGAVDRATVREVLEGALAEDASGRGFVSGSVTVAELRPMRSLPYRVIAVAGLDDGFPRQDPPPGFDLVARRPRRGDRSIRLDDRQLFLEVLLSARDRLVLSAVGRSARDDSARSLSVCVEELLEVVDRGHTTEPASEKPSARLRVVHRLQPFHPAYLGGEENPGWFTYDPAWAAAAGALRARRAGGEPPGVPVFVDVQDAMADPTTTVEAEVASSAASETIELDELVRFWRDPSRWYVRERLELRLRRDETDVDEEPLALDGLRAWSLRERVWRRRVEGRGEGDPVAVLQDLGLIPGRLGRTWTALEMGAVRALLTAGEIDPGAWRWQPVEIEGADYRLVGRLPLHADRGLVRVTAGRAKAAELVATYVEHLALGAADTQGPLPPWRTELCCLGAGSDPVQVWTPAAASNEDTDTATGARRRLDVLVDGYRRAHRAPLPFFPATSQAWFEAWWKEEDAPATDPELAALPDALPDSRRVRALAGRSGVRRAWSGDGFGRSRPDAEQEAVALLIRGQDEAAIFDRPFALWAMRVFGGIVACGGLSPEKGKRSRRGGRA